MQTSEEILSSIDIFYANDHGHCPRKVSFHAYIGDFTNVSLAELIKNKSVSGARSALRVVDGHLQHCACTHKQNFDFTSVSPLTQVSMITNVSLADRIKQKVCS